MIFKNTIIAFSTMDSLVSDDAITSSQFKFIYMQKTGINERPKKTKHKIFYVPGFSGP